jgi:lipopolysaccharide/colanic/teichoic acid biosynthesis glycosyltransferase
LLKAYGSQRQPVIAVLDEDPAMIGRTIMGVRVLGAPQELEAIISEYAIHGVSTDRVVIAGETDLLRPVIMQEVENICKRRQIDLAFLPRLIGLTEGRQTEAAGALELVGRSVPPVEASPYFRMKRWVDVVGSLILCVVLFPVLVAASILVLVDVGRPLLFWQERLGWKGRSFLVYKFRTLRAPFDSAGNVTLADRRPSVIGRFLRATRIDELPQLINVMLGDMSLIGPRPLLPEDQPSNTSIRLSVRPGITGWAQVNGAKLVSKEEKERLDEWYVRNASIWVDIHVVLRTVELMFSSRTSSAEAMADAEQVETKTAMKTEAVPSIPRARTVTVKSAAR